MYLISFNCLITFLFNFYFYFAPLIVHSFRANTLAMCSFIIPTKAHEIEIDLKWKPECSGTVFFLDERSDRIEQPDATKTNTHIFRRPEGCLAPGSRISLRRQVMIRSSAPNTRVARVLPDLIMWNYLHSRISTSGSLSISAYDANEGTRCTVVSYIINSDDKVIFH